MPVHMVALSALAASTSALASTGVRQGVQEMAISSPNRNDPTKPFMDGCLPPRPGTAGRWMWITSNIHTPKSSISTPVTISSVPRSVFFSSDPSAPAPAPIRVNSSTNPHSSPRQRRSTRRRPGAASVPPSRYMAYTGSIGSTQGETNASSPPPSMAHRDMGSGAAPNRPVIPPPPFWPRPWRPAGPSSAPASAYSWPRPPACRQG